MRPPPPTPYSIERDLHGIPVFNVCDDAFFSALSPVAQLQKHQKGHIIFLNDDAAERFYFIKSGWVKLFRETLDGTQAVIDVFPAGHLFGDTALFENYRYPYSAEMVENGEIISMPLSMLHTEIQENNKLALNLLNAMALYRREQDNEIERRSIQNASQRIGCFLLRLTEKNASGSVKIHLPYDKTLVAARLGMQPETFSRALSKLREKTNLRVMGATIEIDDLSQLLSYSCTACSATAPCHTA